MTARRPVSELPAHPRRRTGRCMRLETREENAIERIAVRTEAVRRGKSHGFRERRSGQGVAINDVCAEAHLESGLVAVGADEYDLKLLAGRLQLLVGRRQLRREGAAGPAPVRAAKEKREN